MSSSSSSSSISSGDSSSGGIKITKSDLLGHFSSRNTRHSIYSLDFQPHGARLATGGADCAVKIWNVDSLLNVKESSPVVVSSSSSSFSSTSSTTSSLTGTGCAISTSTNDPLLSSFSLHTKAVNCVRWSKDGRYLASGSDDTFIIIYHKLDGFNLHSKSSSSSSSSKNVFGSNNQETWTRCFTLHGHNMDVLDIDWSPLGLLASASVDNLVMIWNPFSEQHSNNRNASSSGGASHMIPTVITPMRVLRGHEGFVKGVSFDPMGRFLLSCGSDNFYICWDGLKDFSQVYKTDHIAKNAPDNSLFRRLSWSPDGASVLGTIGIKSYRAVSAVIKRGKGIDSSSSNNNSSTNNINTNNKSNNNTNSSSNSNTSINNGKDGWDTVAELVGHEASVAAGRFCPLLFKNSNSAAVSSNSSSNSSPPATSSLVVVGDLLGVISLWTSNSSRSPLVIREALGSAVTDISWHFSARAADGRPGGGQTAERIMFAASSLDGNVVLVEVNDSFGKRLTDNEFNDHISRYYGWDYDNNIREMKAKITGVSDSNYYSSNSYAGGSGGGQIGGSRSATNVLHPIVRKYMNPDDKKKSSSTSAAGVTASSSSIGDSVNGSLVSHSSNNNNNNSNNNNNNDNMADFNILDMQKESLSKSGKKRIQPVSLTSLYNESLNTASGMNSSLANNNTNSGLPVSSSISAFRNVSSGNTGQTSSSEASALTAQFPKRSSSSTLLDEAMMRPKRSRTPVNFGSDDNNGSGGGGGGPLIVTNNAPYLRLYYSDSSFGDNSAANDSLINSSNSNTVNQTFNFCDFSHILSGKNFISIPVRGANVGNNNGNNNCNVSAARFESSSNNNLLIQASVLHKPNQLNNIKFSGDNLSLLSLARASESSSNSNSSNGGKAGGDSAIWKAVVSGSISAICAICDPLQDNNAGLCCVGTLDGTLTLMSLQSGMKVSCDFVVGAPVTFMDIITTPSQLQSTTPSFSTSLTSTYMLALLTADGDMIVYSISKCKLRIISRTTIHTISKSLSYKLQLKVYNLSEGSSACKAADAGSGCKCTVTVDRFYFDSQGCPLISLAAITSSNNSNSKGAAVATAAVASIASSSSNLNTAGAGSSSHQLGSVSHSRSADLVDWQSFYYCLDSETWVRVSDLKNTLSSLFLNSSSGDSNKEFASLFQTYHNRGSNNTANFTTTTGGDHLLQAPPILLSSLQSMSVRKVDMTEGDVAKISNAVNKTSTNNIHNNSGGSSLFNVSAAVLHSHNNNNSNNGSNNSINSSSSGEGAAGARVTLPMNQWVALSTLAHIESRLCACGVFSSSAEAVYWLQEYTTFCVKNGLQDKIISLFDQLLNGPKSSTSSSGSIPDASLRYSDYSWIENITDRRKVIDFVIIPTLGALSQSSAVAQDLLVHIYETVKDVDLVEKMI